MGALAGAFTLACPQGYVRVFADEGAPMGVLLGRLVAAQRAEHATARSVPLSCLARVLQALSQNHAVPGSGPRTAAVPGLVEQLTARELEILRLVAAGTPNQAIAGRLGERGQQVELQRRKPDRRAVGLYLTGIGIDGQAVEPQHGRAGLVHPPVPPQHRLDPGGDLPRAERLSHIIIRADPEPDQLVDFLGAGKLHAGAPGCITSPRHAQTVRADKERAVMKLTRKHVVTGLAAAGLMAGALTAGVALASTGSAPISATSASATPSYGPGTGNCGGMYGMQAGQQPVMTAAADYLGLSLTQLRTQLHAGTSLADIATAQGKPASGLKDAILAAMTSRINADTALTAQQKAAMISQVKGHLDTMINRDMDHVPGPGMGWHMTATGSPMGGMWR